MTALDRVLLSILAGAILFCCVAVTAPFFT